jgi:hypothetical protein
MAGVFAPGGLAASSLPPVARYNAKPQRDPMNNVALGDNVSASDANDIDVYEKAAVQCATALAVVASQQLLQHPIQRQIGIVDAETQKKYDMHGASIVLKGLADLVSAATTPEIQRCLSMLVVKKPTDDPKLRPFFEKSGPTTQCGNTIPPVRNPDNAQGNPANMTPCWICGFGIPTFIEEHPLRPECEHIFPIAQALCFTGLYEFAYMDELAKSKGVTVSQAYVEGVKVEYDWAHRICNQIKNDTHFIKIETGPDGKPSFGIDGAPIVEMLDKIVTSTSFGNGGPALVQWMAQCGVTPDQWAQTVKMQRVGIIGQRCSHLLGIVFGKGLTVEEHCKQTIMCLRSYIAREPACVLTTEIETAPVRVAHQPHTAMLPSSSQDSIAMRDYAISKIVIVALCAAINITVVTNNLPAGGTSGERGARSKIPITMYDLANNFARSVREAISDNFLRNVRLQIISFLVRKTREHRLARIEEQRVRGYTVTEETPFVKQFGPRLQGMFPSAGELRIVEIPDDEHPGQSITDSVYVPGPEVPTTIDLTLEQASLWYAVAHSTIILHLVRDITVKNINSLLLPLKNKFISDGGVEANWPAFESKVDERFAQFLRTGYPDMNDMTGKDIGPGVIPGTTIQELLAEPVMVDGNGQPITQAMFQQYFFQWFMPGGKRKTRKRKSKKRKTYRKKRLF